MTGIKEIILSSCLHDRPRTNPGILPGVRSFEHDLVLFRVGHKILCSRKIYRMVIGVAAFFQIVNIIHSVLVIRHCVPDIRLNRSILGRQKKCAVLIRLLLTPRRCQFRKVFILHTRLPAAAEQKTYRQT